jgi:hypothetical protein
MLAEFLHQPFTGHHVLTAVWIPNHAIGSCNIWMAESMHRFHLCIQFMESFVIDFLVLVAENDLDSYPLCVKLRTEYLPAAPSPKGLFT